MPCRRGAGLTPLLPASFCARDGRVVARALIGMHLHAGPVTLAITEVEAYLPGDSAAHSRHGLTPRNAAMWGAPGHAYVYLCYGIHWMLNVVTERDGVPGAVLIRAAEPVAGLEDIRRHRGGKEGPVLLTGPGKVGAALGLNRARDGDALFLPGGLELREGTRPNALLAGPRVGIDYAEPEHRGARWRYAKADSPWVSHRRRLTPLDPLEAN